MKIELYMTIPSHGLNWTVQRVKTGRSFRMKALKGTVYQWTFTCEYSLKCIRWYILFQPIHFQFSFSYFSVSKQNLLFLSMFISPTLFFRCRQVRIIFSPSRLLFKTFFQIQIFSQFPLFKRPWEFAHFSWKLVMFNSQPLFVFWIIDYWLNFDSFGDRAAGNRWTEHWDDDD